MVKNNGRSASPWDIESHKGHYSHPTNKKE